MPYLSRKKLISLNFKRIGKNVLISDKASIYNTQEISIDDNTRIDDFVIISGKVSFGKYVHIATHTSVSGGTAGIIFSDFSSCAYNCHLFSQTDDYSGSSMTNPTVPQKYANPKKGPIYVGRHVIIGTGSIVFPGTRIEDGCSIGAMSLVNKSTEPFSIYVGVPAKKIKPRKKDFLKFEKLMLKIKIKN
jgi:acetyltransferase-like isoleucine patch superfamily enzyme